MKSLTVIGAIAIGAAALAAGAAASPDYKWSWVNPTPNGDSFNAVAYGNGTYLAAGDDGIIYTSTDSSHWTAQTGPLGLGAVYQDAVYANGRFILGGTDEAGTGHVSLSVDGVSWTDAALPLSMGQFAYDVGYGGGVYVATGNVAAVSQDGKTWTVHPIAAVSDTFGPPAYANGVFASLGRNVNGNFIYYSADGGVTWHQSSTVLPSSSAIFFYPYSLVSNGSGFLLTGVFNSSGCFRCGVVYTSSDGNSWTKQLPAGWAGGFPYPPVWDGSRYLALSLAAGSGDLIEYSSTDGAAWSRVGTLSSTTRLFAPAQAHPLAAGAPGSFVALGTTLLGLQSSSDLVNWSQVQVAAVSYSPFFQTLVAANGKFFDGGTASGSPSFTLRESGDGLHWNTVYQVDGGTVDGVAYGNGIYVTVPTALLSSDGSHWRPAAHPPTAILRSVAYGDGLFVAAGGYCAGACFPSVFTSPDGETWTSQDVSSLGSLNLYGLVSTGSEFVAIGQDFGIDGSTFEIVTSPDGINWSVAATPSLPSKSFFQSLQWSGGQLVMTADNASGHNLFTSTDGVNWTGDSVVLGGEPALFDASFDGVNYYALGFDHRFYTSTDRQNWTAMSGVPHANLSYFIYQKGKIVAVDFTTADVVQGDSGTSGPSGGGGGSGGRGAVSLIPLGLLFALALLHRRK